MFLTTKKLLERFQGNLKHTDQIDIAVAWATSGTALQLLERWKKDHPKRIRAMVGTFGNATEPDALERLANIGELRLAEGDSMLFHPKVYIFRGKSLIVWVGSANLTEGASKITRRPFSKQRKGRVSCIGLRRGGKNVTNCNLTTSIITVRVGSRNHLKKNSEISLREEI